MGWGSVTKAVKKAGRQIGSGAEKSYKEYDRYTSSKFGAYFTPYLSMYDSDGRLALRKAWGNYAAAGAGSVNPAAGAVAGSALAVYDARNASPASSAFSTSGSPSAAPAQDPLGLSPVMIGGLIVGALAVIVTVIAIARRK